MYKNKRSYDHRSKWNKFERRPFRKPRNSYKDRIDLSLYVKKASDFQKIEETEVNNMFEDFGLIQTLLENIKSKGFVKPTAIQDQVINLVLEKHDVLGIANTGTGKTAAFAIPLIDRLVRNPNERVIILAPTRELATQIKQEIRSFTQGIKVYMALAIGGAYMREQIQDIKRDPHIIIGTPGRIIDLAKRRVINFSKMNILVLDEVDRMLDMGFVEDIKSIVEQIPESRQTLFFSATVNKKIDALINSFLKNPKQVSVKTQDSSSHVEQDVVMVSKENKEETLLRLLNKEEFRKVLIFGETKNLVEDLATILVQKGYNADSIHGDKPQFKRQRVLRMFKENEISILVATDVAARGLDIADITHVINYSQPNNYDDYVHRIGRTGRGNAKGFALTFVEQNHFQKRR